MNLRRVSDGSRVRLGPELGRGGEGAVYPVIGDTHVAKVYFKAPSPAKVEKLRIMARSASPALLRVAAWPVELLEDESRRVRGFLMPRVAAREDVHELYSPRSRRKAFPTADFRFIVRAAANIARAFARVHAEGHVIGDVNHGNALIGKDATVVLIDCDSFQVREGARLFTCDVGVPLFTAPELQDLGFRGLRRSARHDAFGLAVLLFHLLFQGRHPFAGIHVDGEMPIERAIAEARFAYGASAAQRGMSPPPSTPPLDAFGPRIAELFERAFLPSEEGQRPSANEWIEALDALERELVNCPVSPVHFHARGTHCCWCAIEQRAGLRLFGSKAILELLDTRTVAALWGAIVHAPRPRRDKAFPKVPRFPYRPPRWLPRKFRPSNRLTAATIAWFGSFLFLSQVNETLSLIVLAAGVTVGAIATAWWRLRLKALKSRSVRAVRKAELLWETLGNQWRERGSAARFKLEADKLLRLHRELVALPRTLKQELRELQRKAEKLAREQFLASKPIDITLGLRPQDVTALALFGYETAGDVLRHPASILHAIPRAKAEEVVAWARNLHATHRFDKSAPIDPGLVAQVEQNLAQRQQELLAQLRDGPATLEKTRLEIEDAREWLDPAMERAWENLQKARKAADEAGQQ